jgi:DNA-binding NarL/FixJ family response regulator
MTESRMPLRAARSPYAVLIADTSEGSRTTLEQALVTLGPQAVSHAADCDELERLFFDQGPYDLVVCRALLGARSGLQVLARARSAGQRASFIVYSSLDGPWLRVFVSDAESTVLSSRVVSLEGVAQLAAGLLEAARR